MKDHKWHMSLRKRGVLEHCNGIRVGEFDLDVIDFADLPPYVHLLVEQLINQEPVGYALTSHVLQEIEDRAYQMTV